MSEASIVRILSIPESTKRRLLTLRMLSGTIGEPHLDERAVQAAQRELGVALGDVLLAIFANGDDATRGIEAECSALPRLTREFTDAGGPDGFIGFGASLDGRRLLGMNASGLELVRFDPRSERTDSLSIDTWLDEHIAAEKDSDSAADDVTPESISDSDVAAFVPAVVRNETVGKDVVTHPKFGRGVVLSYFDADKVEVHFDGEEHPRKLLARFVTKV